MDSENWIALLGELDDLRIRVSRSRQHLQQREAELSEARLEIARDTADLQELLQKYQDQKLYVLTS
jgi:hypothetical protein